MFGSKPREYPSTLEKGDHPEVDTSEELDEEGIKKYQTMIGCLQWAILLGRFDIQTATTTMSGFRTAPRQGHLNRRKRIYGYLLLEQMNLTSMNYQRRTSIGVTVYMEKAKNYYPEMRQSLLVNVTTVAYMDANLYHDLLTGISATGVLHLINQTLIDWFSRRQATVETATFGSEFTAARAVDLIIDLLTTLRYLGVPVNEKSFMFGNNQAVVNNSSIPHFSLNKRHNALAHHRVREMIAANVLGYYWIDGKANPADIVSKHWGYPKVWHLLKPFLFYSGETADLIHRKDIEFNPDPHPVQANPKKKHESTTPPYCTTNKPKMTYSHLHKSYHNFHNMSPNALIRLPLRATISALPFRILACLPASTERSDTLP
jgi:hypothetical protein